MSKIIKLLAIAAVSAGSVNAMAAATVATVGDTPVVVCAAAANKPIIGGTTGDVTGAPITLAGTFIKTAFSITCGANTHAAVVNGYSASANNFGVAGTSAKGNQVYRGGATSGGIQVDAGCTTCDAAAVTTAIERVIANGS